MDNGSPARVFDSRGHRTRVLAATTALLAITGAGALGVASAQEAGRTGSTTTGVWRTDGYGTALTVRDGRVRQYEITGSSCLKGASATHTGGHRYATADGETFTLRRTAGRDRAAMHVDGSPGDRLLRRVDALPAACDRPVARTR